MKWYNPFFWKPYSSGEILVIMKKNKDMWVGEAAQGMGWNSCGPGLNNLHPWVEIAAQQWNIFLVCRFFNPGLLPLGWTTCTTKMAELLCRFFKAGVQAVQPRAAAISTHTLCSFTNPHIFIFVDCFLYFSATTHSKLVWMVPLKSAYSCGFFEINSVG